MSDSVHSLAAVSQVSQTAPVVALCTEVALPPMDAAAKQQYDQSAENWAVSTGELGAINNATLSEEGINW